MPASDGVAVVSTRPRSSVLCGGSGGLCGGVQGKSPGALAAAAAGDKAAASAASNRLLVAAVACACAAVGGLLLSAVGAPSLRAELAAGVAARTALGSASAPAFPSWASSADAGAAKVTVTYVVYNVTNHREVLHGAPPALAELPPLHYALRQEKLGVYWDADEGGEVVSYTPFAGYSPADAATAEGQRTVVITPNLPLLLALSSPIAAYVIATTPLLTVRDRTVLAAPRCRVSPRARWSRLCARGRPRLAQAERRRPGGRQQVRISYAPTLLAHRPPLSASSRPPPASLFPPRAGALPHRRRRVVGAPLSAGGHFRLGQ